MNPSDAPVVRDPREILRELKLKVQRQAMQSFGSAVSTTERTGEPYALFPSLPYEDPLTRLYEATSDEWEAFQETARERENRNEDDLRRARVREHLDEINRHYDPLATPENSQAGASAKGFLSRILLKFRLWLIRPGLLRQQQINAEMVRFNNSLMEVIDETIYHQRLLNDHHFKLSERFLKILVTLQETRDKLKHQWDIQHLHFEEVVRRLLDDIMVDLANVWKALKSTQSSLDKRNHERMATLHASLAAHQSRIESFLDELHRHEGNLVLDRSSKGDISGESAQVDSFFTDEFRGSFADVQERQRNYLHLFSTCSRILDIGCGRGEFLELLRKEGLAGEGVELNPDQVTACRERGLVVTQSDALDFLDSTPENHFDGIFAAQVIEHIPAEMRPAFLRKCFSRLSPGGKCVLETVNPLSIHALSRNFLLDPSHQTPLHPEALLFQTRIAGFEQCEIRYLNPVPEKQMLPHLAEQKNSATDDIVAKLNEIITQLNSFLYGFQDFAIIAQKPGRKT